MEASSMFLEFALQQLELPEGGVMLDLCAAPGGKSLILKDHFPKHLLLSNEIEAKRSHILRENSIRWGVNRHIIVNSSAEKINQTGVEFDLILVDAPCSGEGLFRKDPLSRSEWTKERAGGCALRQERILEDTLPMLTEGAYLVYSTCTYNPEENLDRVCMARDNDELNSIELQLPEDTGIERIEKDGVVGYQFWPHRIKGEGFFIAVLRKAGYSQSNSPFSSKSNQRMETPVHLDEHIIEKYDNRYYAYSSEEHAMLKQLRDIPIVKKGVFLGEEKGKDFLVSHDFAMQPAAVGQLPKLELDLSEATLFLKGNAIIKECDKGSVLICYEGVAIGVGKSNGKRINNRLPKHLRIH